MCSLADADPSSRRFCMDCADTAWQIHVVTRCARTEDFVSDPSSSESPSNLLYWHDQPGRRLSFPQVGFDAGLVQYFRKQTRCGSAESGSATPSHTRTASTRSSHRWYGYQDEGAWASNPRRPHNLRPPRSSQGISFPLLPCSNQSGIP